MGRIIDVDAHYLTSVADITDYLEDDDPWKERFDQSNRLFPKSTGERAMYGRITRDVSWPDRMGPEDVRVAMDHVGVDDIILIAQRLLATGIMAADDERARKFANGYVDYMLDRVLDPADGIYSVIPAPFEDVDASVDLIDRVGDETGFVAVCLVTSGAEPPLGNRKYDPIYAAAEDAGLPVMFHTGGGGLDSFHIKGYEKFIETHTLGFLTSNAAQLVSVVIEGVPKKFPDLDICFVESGLFYVPMLMNRLDAEYLKRPSEVPFLDQPPSEYMKEFYYGTQPLEIRNVDHLEYVFEMIGGSDCLLYASDYPHWDYDPPKVIEELAFLSSTDKAKIFSENAAEVFRI